MAMSSVACYKKYLYKISKNTILPHYIEKSDTEFITKRRSFLSGCAIGIGVMCYGSYGVLVQLSQVNGHRQYNTASIVFFIELSKLIISLVIYFTKGPMLVHLMDLKSVFWKMSFPAVLYMVNNNLAVYMQSYMDAGTFHVLCNLKIISTSVLYRIIMKRKLSRRLWASLFLLLIAGLMNSIGGLKANGHVANSSEVHITPTGMVLMFVYCLNSGLAGVSTEYVLKSSSQLPLSLQNTIMYMFGICLNGGAVLLSKDDGISWLDGHSVYTFLIITTQTVNGLILSMVMKKWSSITKLFMISSAMCCGTALSVIVFALQLNAGFVLSLVIVLLALILYHS